VADDLSSLPPYELGQTDDAGAMPYLIRYLYRGGPDERRLAASAIGKLAQRHREACAVAAVALLDCLDDPAPQVRQYALKALSLIPLPPEAISVLTLVRDSDEKPYNRAKAEAILHRADLPPALPEQAPLNQLGQVEERVEPGQRAVAGSVDTHPPQGAASSPMPPGASITLDVLNKFLEAVYGEPRRLSELLRNNGLSDEAVGALRRERLSPYLNLVAVRLCAWLQRIVPERTADVFVRRFELDGHPQSTLTELGAKYGVSRERARQLEIKVLKRLKSRRSHTAIERLIAEAARESLGLEPASDEAGVAPASPTEPALKVPRPPGPSALLTLTRFEVGLSPAEIAVERGLAEGTIYAHLAACIRNGSEVAARAVTAEMVAAVREVMESEDPPVSFTELRHRLPASYSYGHVLCVVAAHPELLPETRTLSAEELRQARIAVRGAVADLSGVLPRSGLIKLLVGSGSQRIAEQRSHLAYGALAGIDPSALWQIIDDLIIAGDLGLDDQNHLVYIDSPAARSDAEP
jgi:hypothetical protein